MRRNVFIFVAGTFVLAPIVAALCCDSLVSTTIALVYGVVLWHSPKFSPKVRKFWRDFWSVNIRLLSTIS